MDRRRDEAPRRGRPLRLYVPRQVNSPARQLKWLMRVHRLLHADSALANNRQFATRLSEYLQRPVTAERISKFESLSRPLTDEVLVGYEKALGLAPGILTALYAYLRRNHMLDSTVATEPVGFTSIEDFDLVDMARDGSALSIAQWEVVAALYQVPAYIRSPRTRRHIGERLVHELNRAVGADAGRMREVTLRMAEADEREVRRGAGADQQWLVPALLDSIRREPVGAYAAMEVLGFMDAGYSVDTVAQTLTAPPDSWIVRATLETYTRFGLRNDLDLSGGRGDEVRRMALSLLRDRTTTYTVRHQAARLLALVAPADGDVVRAVNGVNDLDVRYAYLEPAPAAAQKQSLIVSTLRRDIEEHQVRDVEDEMLGTVLWRSLFSRNRADRHEAGWLLRASPYSHATAAALGRRLVDSTANTPYEYQRAMVVVLGKLAHISAIATMKTVLDDARRHPTIHVSAAYFLADLPGVVEASWLDQAYTVHCSPDVRRGLVVVAVKGGHHALLERAAGDTDGDVARYARHWLNHIDR